MIRYNGKTVQSKTGNSLGRLQFGPPPAIPAQPTQPAQPKIVQSDENPPAQMRPANEGGEQTKLSTGN